MVSCLRLSKADPERRELWLGQATGIFFETAYAKTFGSEEERDAFFLRWFGNYARWQPDAFFIATDKGNAIGYLAGCVDSYANASKKIIGEIDYFTSDFCAALKAYPAHLHINVKPEYQGRGVGRMLIADFCTLCRRAGSPGVHAVTGEISPAVKFYESCGFKRLTPFMAARSGLAVVVRPLG